MQQNVVGIDEFLFNEEEAVSPPPADEVISVDDAVSQLGILIDDSVEFIATELMPEWEKAEEYYDGQSDLPTIKGRSKATDTSVRDSVRAVKTAIMRSLLNERYIVQFNTDAPALAPLSVLQTMHANNLFWNNGGYSVLTSVVHDAVVKKNGIAYVKWTEDYSSEHFTATKIDGESLEALRNNPNVSITNTERLNTVDTPLFNVEFSYIRPNGRIHMEYVPLHEFFISDTATTKEDARVIGRRRSMHVGDCVAMGLEYDDWDSLDDLDTEEYHGSGESYARRGYIKRNMNTDFERDPSMKKILLTEVYARFDLDGTGVPQLYCFYLGGTNYELIYHEKVSEIPFHVFTCDPQPGTFFAKSLFDVMKETQDVNTSLLRATIDNAHLSNNRRLAVHETMVNLSDVLSPEIGAPIRVRAPGMIQEIGTQPTIGAMLPLLQYLNQRGEVKSGMTSAAMGLDPQAMQSTDKDAVRNTIDLAKGQVEYYTRNLAETGVASMFKHILNLSIRHMPSEVEVYGYQVPQTAFMPNLPIKANVGLGNGDRMEKIAFLNQIEAYQQQAFQQFGISNPITSLEQHYNTISDRARLVGIDDISRYMNAVDQETAAQFMQELMQRNQPPPPPDPTEGLIEVEKIKAQAQAAKAEFDAQIEIQRMEEERNIKDEEIRARMTEILMKDDLSRDEMLQRLYIEAAKLNSVNLRREEVEKAQLRNNNDQSD